MGSKFEFTIVAENSDSASAMLDRAVDEVERIERLISSWDPDSQTSALNSGAGHDTVAVDSELRNLISRSIHLSKLTQGAFDITVGGLVDLWRRDGSMQRLPDREEVRRAAAGVGRDKVAILDDGKVYLRDPSTRLSFGAIGKGYAADRVVELLISAGAPAGVINAAGDLRAWGEPPHDADWRVGVADPAHQNSVLFWIPARDRAVATSGDYVQYVEIEGKRYSHIIDPRTGLPAEHITSSTVVSQSAELSDALATALSVLGPDVGIDLVEQMPDVEAVLIDSGGDVHISSGLEYIAAGEVGSQRELNRRDEK
jgi:thiamine biosynthesis lipoprotein